MFSLPQTCRELCLSLLYIESYWENMWKFVHALYLFSTRPHGFEKMQGCSVECLALMTEWGKLLRVQNSNQHFDHTCRRLFTEEVENVMLWSANWNRSHCNAAVNISYQTIQQPRNVFNTFWKCLKMNRESRIRFQNLKRAAKVKKENFSMFTMNN